MMRGLIELNFCISNWFMAYWHQEPSRWQDPTVPWYAATEGNQ